VGKATYFVIMAIMVFSSVAGDWFLATFAKQKQDCRAVVACLMLVEIMTACVLGTIYPKMSYALVGFVLCTAAVACFLATLYFGTLFKAAINFDVITAAMVMATSIFVLKEEVNRWGVVWGVVAVFCVYMMHRCTPE